MVGRLAVMAVALMLGTGCSKQLGTLEGNIIGKPESVVFARNDSGHIMLVLSDLPDLCDSLAGSDPPDTDDFWILSSWTHVGVNDPGEYAVEAFVAISKNQVIEEYDTEAGGIKFKRLGVDVIKAKVDLTFPGNDRLKGVVLAEYCDADLFVGMY